MKIIILALTILASITANSSECTNYEAQIIGKIESLTKVQDVCFYKIKVLQINEHVFCPLTKAQIEEGQVEFEAGYYTECPYRFEKIYTGILIKGSDQVLKFD